jgi:peptide/nickel transport system permease protein
VKRLALALWADKLTLFAVVVFSVVLLGVLFGPMVTPYGPTEQNLAAGNLPPFSSAGDGSAPHLLGTDQLGRDLLARLLDSGRISMSIGFIGVLLSGTLGTMLGVAAGYFRGVTDNIIMRVVDAQLALPFLLVALFVLFVFGRGMVNVVLVLVFVTWPTYARVARSLALQIREQAYIDGARVIGCSQRRMVLSHVVPNLLSPMIVLGTLEVARLILAESTLSFLGMGIQPPGSSWGLMVAQGRDVMGTAPWNVWLPGLFIFVTALSVTLLASWMRAVTDPAQRWRWLQGKAKTSPGEVGLTDSIGK